ncbi:hypothetical protein MCEMIH16_01618 [Caulobacteraceae bacterium]
MPAKTDKTADRIFFLVVCFIVAIFAEGILRRWIAPGLGYPLVFIRDPILLMIYATAILGGFVGANVRPMAVFIAASAMYLALVFVQISATALNPLIPAFGFRTYLLYFPLPFVMYHFLNKRHFDTILKILLWCFIPIGMLTAVQYYSSPSSIWNIAPEGFGDVALIEANRVRPYGVFTNSIAHIFFAMIALCVFLRFMVAKKSRGFPTLALPFIGLATVMMGALSGSRTYFILAPLVIALFMYGALIGPNVRRGASIVFVLTIVILIAIAGVFLVFPDVVETLINRQKSAVSAEGSTFGRLAFMGTDFIRHLSIAEPFGAGAGLGTNIGSFIYAGRRTFAVTEYELPRIVLEFGPMFGLIHIGLRFAFVAYLFRRATQAARAGELLPISLMGVIIPLFTAGPLTTQNSLLSIGWFAAGLCLLACKPEIAEAVISRRARSSRRAAGAQVEVMSPDQAGALGDSVIEGESVIVEPVQPPSRGGLDAITRVISDTPAPKPARKARLKPKASRESKAKAMARIKLGTKLKPKTRTKTSLKRAPRPTARPTARSRIKPAPKPGPGGGKAPGRK